jgi:toxin FitB
LYLLDTNVISELRRQRPHGAVLAWLRGIADADLHVSAASIGEMQAGIELTRGQDPARADELEEWLNRVEETYSVVPMDGRTFRLWARLMHRRSDDLAVDAMVAATTLANNLVLVTRNVRDFRRFGVNLLNPFATERGR